MDSKVLRFTIRVILVTASALANPAGALTLVDQGRSDYVILLPADAIEAEAFAAEELAVHIQSMSGVRLPVVRDSGEPAPQRTVLLGMSEALNKADPSLKGRPMNCLRRHSKQPRLMPDPGAMSKAPGWCFSTKC